MVLRTPILLALRSLLAAGLASGVLWGLVTPAQAAPTPAHSAPSAGVQDGDRESLQDLLRRQRKLQQEELAGLAGPIAAAMDAVEKQGERNRERELTRQRRSLLELGPSAAPLIVPYLEPGDESKRSNLRRAEFAADVLVEFASPAVTDALLSAASKGTVNGRLMALRALASSPEPARVAPAVRDLYQTSSGVLQRSALECLAVLGGEEAGRLVDEALQNEDVDLAAVALEALASTRKERSAERVIELLGTPRAKDLVRPIVQFFRAVPDPLGDDDTVDALMDLTVRPDVSTTNRIRLLDLMRESEDLKLSRGARKLAETMADGTRIDVSEAALAMLARHKDRAARRKLLEPYDDRVKRQPEWASSYAERGDIYERIGYWSDAVSDYSNALRFASTGRHDDKVYRGLARSLARLKKYKDAADYIRQSRMSFDERRTFAADPAFAGMLKSKYGDVFQLEEKD